MATRSAPSRATLLALEAPRAAGELALLAACSPLLARSPRGDGHTVLVMPGLGASDVSTRPLRRFLKRSGTTCTAGDSAATKDRHADARRRRSAIPGPARAARRGRLARRLVDGRHLRPPSRPLEPRLRAAGDHARLAVPDGERHAIVVAAHAVDVGVLADRRHRAVASRASTGPGPRARGGRGRRLALRSRPSPGRAPPRRRPARAAGRRTGSRSRLAACGGPGSRAVAVD